MQFLQDWRELRASKVTRMNDLVSASDGPLTYVDGVEFDALAGEIDAIDAQILRLEEMLIRSIALRYQAYWVGDTKPEQTTKKRTTKKTAPRKSSPKSPTAAVLPIIPRWKDWAESDQDCVASSCSLDGAAPPWNWSWLPIVRFSDMSLMGASEGS